MVDEFVGSWQGLSEVMPGARSAVDQRVRAVEIGRMTAREGAGEPSLGLKASMMKRARVIASARNKIPALRNVLRDRPAEAHTLFYCGDGQVDADDNVDARDDADPEFSGRQIEVVSQHLDDSDGTGGDASPLSCAVSERSR